MANNKAEDGGFFDILHDPGSQGSMRRRNRSILDNAAMAESLVRLSYLSRRAEFYGEATAALEAFANTYREYGYYVAGYGRAVDLIFYEPLFITIVGDREAEASAELRRSGAVPVRAVAHRADAGPGAGSGPAAAQRPAGEPGERSRT